MASSGRVPGARSSQAQGQSPQQALCRLSCGRPTCQVLSPSGFCAVTLTPSVCCPARLAPGRQPAPLGPLGVGWGTQRRGDGQSAWDCFVLLEGTRCL